LRKSNLSLKLLKKFNTRQNTRITGKCLKKKKSGEERRFSKMSFQTINATGSRPEPKPILVPLPLSPWQQTRLR